MIWHKLQHFKPNENWGDPGKMNGLLLLLIDGIRHTYDRPFKIHCGYDESGHTTNSQHYLGNAIDFHIEGGEYYPTQIDKILKILDWYQVSDKVGLGIYPDWAHQGFHLDVRGTKARWGRIGKDYFSFDFVLKQIGG